MDAVDVVALSGRLPDIVLKEYRHWTSITFRGRGFAWVDHTKDTAMVKSTHSEREAMIGSDPETFAAGWASRSTAWVSIELRAADPEEVFEILADAWRMTATKKAVAAYDAANPARR
ncbi:MAG: MmcQ/YjbR family DNA-binding protein [Nocardioides sp.]